MEKNIPVAEFKTHCYNLLAQASKSNSQLIITRRGKSIAKVTPIDNNKKLSIVGIMQGRAIIKDNIVNSIDVLWDADSE